LLLTLLGEGVSEASGCMGLAGGRGDDAQQLEGVLAGEERVVFLAIGDLHAGE